MPKLKNSLKTPLISDNTEAIKNLKKLSNASTLKMKGTQP